jgi:hypothetical protein
MKITIEEYDGCFSINLQPETLKDAAKIIRLQKNHVKEVSSISSVCRKDLAIYCSVVIGKRKVPMSEI